MSHLDWYCFFFIHIYDVRGITIIISPVYYVVIYGILVRLTRIFCSRKGMCIIYITHCIHVGYILLRIGYIRQRIYYRLLRFPWKKKIYTHTVVLLIKTMA